jgi:excisionase family DNA binding protein
MPMIKSTLLSGIEHSALQLGEVARRLSCSRRFLEKQVAAGRLRVVRLSPRCVRIRPTDLAEYLERNARESKTGNAGLQ